MKKLLYALLFLGIALRIVVFFQNRSLFLDEANLARNIIEKPIDQYFQPLDYEQYAPPLFLIIEKASTILFSNSEYALRLFPLIMGIVAFFFFYIILLKSFDQPYWLWFPIFLFAFSPELVRYSSEVKQYMVDTGMGLFLVWLATYYQPESWQKQSAIMWLMVGMITIWLSMPVVFLLSGIGLYYLFSFYRIQDFQHLRSFCLLICGWLISFGLFYWTILRPSLATNLLIDYHATHFLPLFPKNASEWTKAANIILGLFRIPFGFTVIAYLGGISLFLFGIYTLFKENKAGLILLGVPILSCLLASGFGFYSLMPRLSLFLIPLILLICCFGIHWLWNVKGNWLRYALFTFFLLIVPLKNAYRFFYQRLEIEEIKPVMTYIKDQYKPTDLIFLNHEAAPAFLYYYQLDHKPVQYPQAEIYTASWNETPASFFAQNELPTRIWLVFSHLISDHTIKIKNDNLDVMPNSYVKFDQVESQGAAAYLFVIK